MSDSESTTAGSNITVTTTSSASEDHVEPIVKWLFYCVMGLVALLIVVDKMMPNDGQIFQVIASLVSGFSGALLMRIKPKGSTADTSSTTTTGVQADTPKA